MRPGRKAASKMPSDGCVALFPARPISPPSQCTASAASSLFTITPHENALTSKHPPRPSPKRCTSSVNPPPPRSRGRRGSLMLPRPHIPKQEPRHLPLLDFLAALGDAIAAVVAVDVFERLVARVA